MDPTGVEESSSLLQRTPMLAACLDGPTDRATIAKRAACSRATVYRATDDLIDRGLLERTAGGFRTTNFGTTLLEHAKRFHTDVDGASKIRSLLEYMDVAELVEHTHLFTDATVIEADSSSPYIIEQRLESFVRGATDEIRTVSDSFGPPTAITQTYERIIAGTEFEWITTQAMIDGLRTQYGEPLADIEDRENVAVYVVPETTLNYTIFDDQLVLVGTDDERGSIAVIVTTDDSEAVEWGRRVVDDYRQRATRVI